MKHSNTTGSGRTILSYAKILKIFKMIIQNCLRDKTRPKRNVSIKSKKIINYKPNLT